MKRQGYNVVRTQLCLRCLSDRGIQWDEAIKWTISLTIKRTSTWTHTSNYTRALALPPTHSTERVYAPEAVIMMLPPPNSFPRDGFGFFISADAYLIARKHESEFMRMTSLNCSTVISDRTLPVAMPAWTSRGQRARDRGG